MEHSTLLRSLDLPWLTFIAYWIIKATKTRETQRKESFASRYLVMFVMISGYVFIFSCQARIGVLGRRFVPDTLAVVIFAVVVTWPGVGRKKTGFLLPRA
jgi:hypothetical protein